ncbi:MAG: hypothetical protein R6U13_06500 [Desulfatiglandaceae bacterium]
MPLHPRGRYRHRYRTLIGDLFDPDTDPYADKAGMALFTSPSIKTCPLENMFLSGHAKPLWIFKA